MNTAPIQAVIIAKLEHLQPVGSTIVRHLLAWSRGELFARNECCQIDLDVEEVLEGSLPDNYVDRPVGTRMLSVLAAGAVPLALEVAQHQHPVEGRWTLRTLPNGCLIVTDARETPVDIDPETLQASVRETNRELMSDDPQRQYRALQNLRHSGCFANVPAVLPLLDRTDPVFVDEADRRHYGQKVVSVLGVEAREALRQLT